MRKKIIPIIALLCLVFVLAVEISSFNDYGTSGNITFTGDENYTRNITIYKNGNVSSAVMNLSGYYDSTTKTGENDSELQWSADTDWDDNGGNATDESWEFPYSNCPLGGYECDLYVNYTKYSDIAKSKFRWGPSSTGANSATGLDVYCYTGSSWNRFYFKRSPSFSTVDSNITSDIPSSCLQESKVQLKFTALAFNLNIRFYEDLIEWHSPDYPTNSYIKLNNTNIWNYTGEFNTSEQTSDFSSILNTALNGGVCDCTGCNLTGNNCTINFTFHSDTAGILEYSNLNITWAEPTSPNQTINKPTGEYSTTQIPYNISASDNDQLETCKYWITRGASLEVSNTSLTCSSEITGNAFVSSQNTAYVFHSWIQDRSGNINYTTSNFSTSVNATIITEGGGGGGTTLIDTSDLDWEMKVGGQSKSFQASMPKDFKRTFRIQLENLGETEYTIKLSCEDINGTGCQYVTFPEDQINLPVLKDQIQTVEFIIQTEEDTIEQIYQFNIVGIDQNGKSKSVTMILSVTLASIITALFSKAFFGVTLSGFPYIFITGVLFFGGLFVFSKIYSKKVGIRPILILFSSFILTSLVIYFI